MPEERTERVFEVLRPVSDGFVKVMDILHAETTALDSSQPVVSKSVKEEPLTPSITFEESSI
jgi:hypothetical protein